MKFLRKFLNQVTAPRRSVVTKSLHFTAPCTDWSVVPSYESIWGGFSSLRGIGASLTPCEWTISITVIPGIVGALGARRGPRASVASWLGSSRWRSPQRGSSGRIPPWRSLSGLSPSNWPPSVTLRSDAYWMPWGSGTWTARAPSSSGTCRGRSLFGLDQWMRLLLIHQSSIMFLD